MFCSSTFKIEEPGTVEGEFKEVANSTIDYTN